MFVYGLIDPRTDCLRYVGKTTSIAKRYSRHCNPRRSDRSHRGCWLRGLRDLGLRPSIVVLEEVNDADGSLVERFWIASLRASGADLVNACDGGEGGATRTGHISTAQHRANIAKARLGIRPDEDTRDKMRWTAERRAKMEDTIVLRIPHPRHIKKHGTWSSYAWGCRCLDCLAFINSRPPQRRNGKTVVQTRPRRTRVHPQHGTTTLYKKGCRCDQCRAVAVNYAMARKKLREGVISVPSERQLAIRRTKSTERQERALEIVRQHGHVSLSMLSRDLGLSPSTLAPVMHALVSEGVLHAIGKTKLRTYMLAVDSDVPPTTPPSSQRTASSAVTRSRC